MRSPDAELRLAPRDPARMVVHLQSAKADDVPSGRRMIPVAVRTVGERTSRLQVRHVIRRARPLRRAMLPQEVADSMHVLPPIQIALGDPGLRATPGDLVRV